MTPRAEPHHPTRPQANLDRELATVVHWVGPEERMRILAILLIVLGIVALMWGGITYTHEKKVLDIGPIEARTKTRETIPLPPILGVVSIGAGVALLVVGRKERT